MHEIDAILRAVWTLTRQAKRYRDNAQSHYQNGNFRWATWNKGRKEECYRLKGQALSHLIAEGVLTAGHGYHSFGGLFAEVVRGHGYVFHRPTPSPSDAEEITELSGVEAKPRCGRELGIRTAEEVVTAFLATRPPVGVYSWPERHRPRATHKHCWTCGSPYHLAADCDDEDDDWGDEGCDWDDE